MFICRWRAARLVVPDWGSLSSACAFGVETIAVMADGLGASCAIKGSNPEPAERHDELPACLGGTQDQPSAPFDQP